MKLNTGVRSFFFIRTSNFDAEAERSYIFWRFEAETFLKMFLNLPGIVKKDLMALKLFWNIIRRTAYAIRKPLLLLHKTSPLVFGSIYIFVHLFFACRLMYSEKNKNILNLLSA